VSLEAAVSEVSGHNGRRFAFLRRRYGRARLSEIADQLERAAEVAALAKPESEANRNNAEAIARFAEAASATPSFFAIAGSVLFIKITDEFGPRIFAKTLTATELKRIQQHPVPLTDPAKILEILNAPQQSEFRSGET
jgi:hypothetical protein